MTNMDPAQFDGFDQTGATPTMGMDPTWQPQSTQRHAHRAARRPMLRDGRFWIGFVVGMAVMFFGIFAIAIISDQSDKAGSQAAFQSIAQGCPLPDDSTSTMSVGDNGRSIDFTLSPNLSADDVKALGCINKSIGTPSATVSKMLQTRALDGMQTDSWDGYKVTWSYGTDTGLQMVYEQQ